MVTHVCSQLTEERHKKEYETSIKYAEPLSQTEVIKSLCIIQRCLGEDIILVKEWERSFFCVCLFVFNIVIFSTAYNEIYVKEVTSSIYICQKT